MPSSKSCWLLALRFCPRNTTEDIPGLQVASLAPDRVGRSPLDCGSHALGHNLPTNFPVIDRFKDGIVTSIKSIDLDAASYLSGNHLRTTLTRYVDKVAGFKGKTWGGTDISQSKITGRSLEIVVPHRGTATQQATIADIVKYGSTRNVTVKVIVGP